ncbi:hypothetical protein BLNAU_3442 [Blattamonas nauphoetae]|uniref:Uncharacterized protein n=1 Tax=Blattamonas nauphoetae TaxID=2049346 RepID=A0ABQ9YD37_9EUKA|nr:hypothetical protein BLNAU_3442 [Blattamonas nauphoetae]
MEEESSALNSTNDSCLNRLPDPRSSVHTLQEPFLNFNPNSELSFNEKSTVYNSLVALVKAEYPFDEALQDRAAQFLENLEPEWGDEDEANQLVTDLVPSSAGSYSGFFESILTLLSSPHSTVVTTALSFLFRTTESSTTAFRSLVKSGLVTKVLATVQPHMLPISGNEEIFRHLVWIIDRCVYLASPSFLAALGITAAVEKSNRREMIFRNVVIPSSQFVTFLISNRHVLDEDLLDSFMFLLVRFIDISPFHRPTLEFVLASPIVMAFSRCLSFVEDDFIKGRVLTKINYMLREWKTDGPKVVQSGKRMIRTLISEGFEDTLDGLLILEENTNIGFSIVEISHSISIFLGVNVEFTED